MAVIVGLVGLVMVVAGGVTCQTYAWALMSATRAANDPREAVV